MNIKKIINSYLSENNKIKLIGVLTILLLVWLVLYLIPELLVSLYNTFLGNIILMLIVILLGSYNVLFGVGLFLLFLILYRFVYLSNQEGFTWSHKSMQDFLKIQYSNNPKLVFDTTQLQKQASQKELDYFLKNGMWPWSQKVIELYKDSIMNNPYVRTHPPDSVNYARKIYNQQAILQILSQQTKEGKFLINGVFLQDGVENPLENLPSGFGSFGYKSGLITKMNDVIKCNMYKNNNNPYLERITYTGKDGITGQQTKKITQVDFKNLEKIIPGFKFLDGPCNPCSALKDPPDYSCPFRLELKNSTSFVSPVWETLWQIDTNPMQSVPSFLTENINPKTYPILNELQTELKKLESTNK